MVKGHGKRLLRGVAALLAVAAGAGCVRPAPPALSVREAMAPQSTPTPPLRMAVRSATIRKVIDSALAQTQVTRSYDPAYQTISYPGGDVPIATGVCSDVVVRAFRAAGVDLQKEIHEDMAAHFGKYPQRWGLQRPDPNIDHRRVPNLMTFFTRQGRSLPVDKRPEMYEPGDVVAWRIRGDMLHVGIVSDQLTANHVPLIVDNWGNGTQLEDVLFGWQIIGHYRYFGAGPRRAARAARVAAAIAPAIRS